MYHSIAKYSPTQVVFPDYSRFPWQLEINISIGSAIRAVINRLLDVDIMDAQGEAVRLLAYVLQRDEQWLFDNYNRRLNQQQADSYIEYAIGRINEELLKTVR